MNGFEIFTKLIGFDLNYEEFDWLANQGLSDFELLISVILTQNTRWNNVLRSLENLRRENIHKLEQIRALSTLELASLIRASGCYNIKSRRLKTLVEHILNVYANVENFKQNVSREWLLAIKGLGFESTDSILNYLCKREILVVDNYTMRLALHLDYDFKHYEQLRIFFQSGIADKKEYLCKILNQSYEMYELYQIFHALIISFAKRAFKGKKLSLEGEKMIQILKEDR